MRTITKGLVPFWDDSLIDRQFSDVTLSALQGKVVRFSFFMRDAELFALRFS